MKPLAGEIFSCVVTWHAWWNWNTCSVTALVTATSENTSYSTTAKAVMENDSC